MTIHRCSPPLTQDPLEQAWLDYFRAPSSAELILHLADGTRDRCLVKEFFRDPDALDPLESFALDLCRGRILDVGAGCGDHSLILQSRGYSVCALDRSSVAVWIMAQRGIQCLFESDFFAFRADGFDTLLLLMNGVGIVGTLRGLEAFLDHCHQLLTPSGQILLDSTDLVIQPTLSSYPREVTFTVEYRGKKGDPFPWLFVDPDTLCRIADRKGWHSQLIYQQEDGQYLARLIH